MVSMQTFFTALADRTRRRILNLLREQEICVNFFTEVLDVSQPKISRHLAYLRNAEIVAARRDGKWIYYSIVQPEDFYARQILQTILDWLASQERMQEDYDKLIQICASTNAPISTAQDEIEDKSVQANMSYVEREELEIFLL